MKQKFSFHFVYYTFISFNIRNSSSVSFSTIIAHKKTCEKTFLEPSLKNKYLLQWLLWWHSLSLQDVLWAIGSLCASCNYCQSFGKGSSYFFKQFWSVTQAHVLSSTSHPNSLIQATEVMVTAALMWNGHDTELFPWLPGEHVSAWALPPDQGVLETAQIKTSLGQEQLLVHFPDSNIWDSPIQYFCKLWKTRHVWTGLCL